MKTDKEHKIESGSQEVMANIKHLPLLSNNDIIKWLKDQVPLINCAFVALSLHVVFVPILWILGWALPWPKPPVITTVIEYDLSDWPRVARPKKVFDVRDPDLN